MADKATVADTIRAAPIQAANALLAVQAGQPNQITLAGIDAFARSQGLDAEDLAADMIERRGLLPSFVMAMKAHRVDLDAEDAGIEDANFPVDRLEDFTPRGRAFRCRLFVNGRFSGSGCLVSPSLVLTAAHVILSAWPGRADPTYDPIEVELSDGTRRCAAQKPIYVSTPTELEYQGKLPGEEASFGGFNDVTLIKLERPEGMRLGFADLPSECTPLRPRSAILLVHFPQGNDKGFGAGHISRVRGVTSRWRHDILTAAGSSGGPCFTTRFTLAGLHQGALAPYSRLVPARLFLDDIRTLVERDIAPPALWSLDGTTHGQLVIGRDLFFEAIAAAIRPTSRVRGIRVKRRDTTQGTTGLAYSLEMLTRTLARNPGAHRTVRINFETPGTDLLDEIRRRAILIDIDVPPTEAGAGVRAGETTLEATVNERATILAAQLNVIAERDQQLIWFLFENPLAGLTDAEHLGFEAFLAAVLRQPRLRLVVTGFETIATPGEEFSNASFADSDGAPGLVVEYFGLFNRRDVEQFLTRACNDFKVAVAPAEIAGRTNQILQGLSITNLQYSVADLKTVSDRAVSHLDYFHSLAEARP